MVRKYISEVYLIISAACKLSEVQNNLQCLQELAEKDKNLKKLVDSKMILLKEDDDTKRATIDHMIDNVMNLINDLYKLQDDIIILDENSEE